MVRQLLFKQLNKLTCSKIFLKFIRVQIFLETQMPEKQYVKSLVAVNFRIQLLTKKLTKRLIELNYDSCMKVNYQDSFTYSHAQKNNNELKLLEQIIFDLMKVLPQASSNYSSPSKENNKALSQQSTKSKIQKTKSNADDHNDKHIIQAMKKIIEVSESIGEFSQMLYNINGIKIENSQGINHSFPLQIYRKFRKIDENIHNSLNNLYSCQLHFEDFKREREMLRKKQTQQYKKLEVKDNSPNHLTKQFCLLGIDSQLLNRQKIDSNSFWENQRSSTLKPIQQEISGSNEQIRDMSETIQQLQNIIFANNEDFRNQIYKYNRRLYDLESQLKIYQETEINAEIQESISHLQKQIDILEEEKNKDKLLINNMAMKIRNYQRILNGSNTLSSPLTRSKHSRTNWKSADKLFKSQIDEFMHRGSVVTEHTPYPNHAFYLSTL